MKKIGCFILLVVLVCLGYYGYKAFFGGEDYLSDSTTYMRITPDYIQAPKLGATGEFTVDYDGSSWAIVEHPSWTEVGKFSESADEYTSKYKFGITVKPNKTGLDRQGVVTVASGKCKASVSVYQKGKATSICPINPNVHFGRSGGTQSFYFSTDGHDWRASTSDDWLSVSYDVNDCDLTIRCSRNDEGRYRRGTVAITEDDIYFTLNVVQE